MALTKSRNGFKMVVAIAVTTVLLSLPVYFLDLHSPGLTLARRIDSSLAPVGLRIDQRERTLRLSTVLSTAIPEGFPLVAHVRVVTSGGTTLAEFFDRQVTRGSHPGVIHVKGPLAITTTWDTATVELRLYRKTSLLLTVVGRYRPGQTNLAEVVQTKPD